MSGVGERQTVGRGTARRSMPARVLPAVLVLYACLLPRELTIEILGIAFPPYRIVLTLLLPYVVYLAGVHRMKLSFADVLVVFAALWMIIALTITESFGSAMVSGLSEALNMAFAYFTGRVALRNSADFRSFFFAVLPGLLLCALILALESVLQQNIYKPFLASLVGQQAVDPGIGAPGYQADLRLGMMRAQGPFSHAILAGVFMSSFTAIAWYLAEKPAMRTLALLAVSGFFFSLSSTGFLGFFVSFGLIMTNYIHRTSKLPVFPAVIAAALFAMFFIQVFSGSGVFPFIIRNLTLDPQTGYFRLLIWEYGGAELNQHPLFGIGTRQYARPAWMVTASVDTHWLLLGLRYGYPAALAVLLSVIWSAATSLRGAWSPYPLDQRAAYAICYALIALFFAGLAVYLYDGVNIWLSLLTGMGVAFGQVMAQATRQGTSARPGGSAPHRARVA